MAHWGLGSLQSHLSSAAELGHGAADSGTHLAMAWSETPRTQTSGVCGKLFLHCSRGEQDATQLAQPGASERAYGHPKPAQCAPSAVRSRQQLVWVFVLPWAPRRTAAATQIFLRIATATWSLAILVKGTGIYPQRRRLAYSPSSRPVNFTSAVSSLFSSLCDSAPSPKRTRRSVSDKVQWLENSAAHSRGDAQVAASAAAAGQRLRPDCVMEDPN